MSVFEKEVERTLLQVENYNQLLNNIVSYLKYKQISCH
jgi:hypothetical protein